MLKLICIVQVYERTGTKLFIYCEWCILLFRVYKKSSNQIEAVIVVFLNLFSFSLSTLYSNTECSIIILFCQLLKLFYLILFVW